MSAALALGDFAAFFEEVQGVPPFPWQRRLAADVAQSGSWPRVLDLPTGSGKTAALDIALFHLALEAGRGPERRAPVRIAFVVDRRLIVDDAFARAEKIASALETAIPGTVAARVAERLRLLSGDGSPLITRRLRGGLPREDDWARTPAQPTILCSTVDQVGSRLLFRGYGVSDRAKPIHAGLLGSDCLVLLDEAHLAEPFRQTLGWVGIYQSDEWRESTAAAPWGFAQLSATPGEGPADEADCARFKLEEKDRQDHTLRRRLRACKPARLVTIARPKRATMSGAEPQDSEEDTEVDAATRAAALADAAVAALNELRETLAGPAIGVVVNRVARARTVFQNIKAREDVSAEIILMIGPARAVDRDKLSRKLDPIRTGAEDRPSKPLIVIATQTIEAGVDIDLDALVTEAASLDALRQRFGRLDRDGRLNADGRKQGGSGLTPAAAVVAHPSDLASRSDDPVYGGAIRKAWELLTGAVEQDGKTLVVDFGIDAFGELLAELPDEMLEGALAPKADAPVLMPAHLDLFSRTAPVPAADPEVGLYLHGVQRQSASVTLLWRSDIDPQQGERTLEILTLVPARPSESIELPVWAVRAWLSGLPTADLADIAAKPPEETRTEGGRRKGQVFRWAGADDERSQWIAPRDIRPGDTLIAPARYGGCDVYGWNPGWLYPVDDLADRAAAPFAGRRHVVRVAPGLLADPLPDDPSREDREESSARARTREADLVAALGEVRDRAWTRILDAVLESGLPVHVRQALERLHRARRRRGDRNPRVELHFPYGDDEAGNPRGVIFLAPLGIELEPDAAAIPAAETGGPASTEDDLAGSLPGFPLSLDRHGREVAERAESFARLAGLPAPLIADLSLAGLLHDLGKAHPRFQAWLYSGDPLRPDPDKLLAKSGRPLPRSARAASGLPGRWRHEALSVRLARHHPCFAGAHDRELVLWLVGTHHGEGRPLFPHAEELETAEEAALAPVLGRGEDFRLPPGERGPQSLAFDHDGLDWPGLYDRLKARYGVWELARLEAILRLADHRASEDSRRQAEAEAAPGDSPVVAEKAAE